MKSSNKTIEKKKKIHPIYWIWLLNLQLFYLRKNMSKIKGKLITKKGPNKVFDAWRGHEELVAQGNYVWFSLNLFLITRDFD